MIKKFYLIIFTIFLFTACNSEKEAATMKALKVSGDGRFLMTEDGKPFFWLGDTGWLLLNKLNREEVELYMKDRSKKGFNVIQVMVLHKVPLVNVYGDSALVNADVSKPFITSGS